MEDMFVYHTFDKGLSDKGLPAKIYKECVHLNNKKSAQSKTGLILVDTSTKKTYRWERKCPSSPIREMLIKSPSFL